MVAASSRWTWWLFQLFGALLLVSFPYLASADTVKLQPAIIEERVDPGETFSSSVRVTNLGSSAQTFVLLARDVESVAEDGQPTFARDTDTPFGLRSWVRFSVPSISLAPGETKEVVFTVNVPQDAAPGGHFGAVFTSVGANAGADLGVGSGIGYEVGTILSLRISGAATEDARIREFRTDASVYDQFPARFVVRVENRGNVLVRPRGPLTFKNTFGKEVGTVIVNDEPVRAVFPNKEREFAVSWSDTSALPFGRYEATVALVYGEDARNTISASLSFWVLPRKAIAVTLGGLAVLFIGGYLVLRAYVRRKVQEAQGGRAPVGELPSLRLLLLTIAAVLFVLGLLFAVFFLFG